VITAKDVERTFRTWLTLAKDEEVLTLADLVYSTLRGRGYALRVEWFKRVSSQVEPANRRQEGSGDVRT